MINYIEDFILFTIINFGDHFLFKNQLDTSFSIPISITNFNLDLTVNDPPIICKRQQPGFNRLEVIHFAILCVQFYDCHKCNLVTDP